MPEGWGVDADADDEIVRLKAFATGLLDLRPFWPRVVPLFVSWMRQQFQTEGVFFGTPWSPLSPAYALQKAVRYPGKSILIAEGDLRRGASLPKRRATPTSLTLSITWPGTKGRNVGKDLDPQWHHKGTDRMPPRPLLSSRLPPPAEMELEKVAEDYVTDLADRLGL